MIRADLSHSYRQYNTKASIRKPLVSNFQRNFHELQNPQSKNCGFRVCVGTDLSSRLASKQVLSARVSLTSVFGMGTGGPSPLKTPTTINIRYQCFLLYIKFIKLENLVHPQGLEPWTPWLRVRCSTNWAKGAYSFDTNVIILHVFPFCKYFFKNF